jgi:hypothetical protein
VVNRLPLPPSALVDPALAELGNAVGGRKPPIAELDAIVGGHLGLSRSAERALRAVVGKSSLDHR